jgi:hypothetical protein
MLRLKDRHQRDFCLGPTHEEVVTDIVRREVQSYKQLPCNLYPDQPEVPRRIRPRFGVMRARVHHEGRLLRSTSTMRVSMQRMPRCTPVMGEF